VETIVNRSESQIILKEAKASVINEETRAKTDGAQNDDSEYSTVAFRELEDDDE
jgi:hypothetical protein